MQETLTMRSKYTAMVVVAGLLLTSAPARAHHAFGAEFDEKRPVELKGTVTKMEWINPHSWIHIDVKGPDGKVTAWMVEAGTPNTLLRRGFTKNSLAPGTEILVDGYQAKDPSNRMNGRDVMFSDGKKLFLGSSGSGAPSDGADPND